MPWVEIVWDLEDDPDGNTQHIARNGVTRDEVAEVLANPAGRDRSRSSGWPIAFGFTSAGRWVAVVYEQIDDMHVYPITAFEPEE